MAILVEVLAIIGPTFLTIGLGQLVFRLGLVGETFLAEANRLLYFVGLPLLMFRSIATAEFSAAFHPRQVLGAALVMSLMFALALAASRLLARSPSVRGAFVQAAIRGNMAYVGLAVILSAHGQAGLAATGVFLGFMVGLMNMLCILGLLLPQGRLGDKALEFWARQIGLNPLILAAAAGLLWSLSGAGLPRVLDETMDLAASMTLPLALLVIGADFDWRELGGRMGLIWSATVIKLVLVPLAMGAGLWAFGVRGMELAVAVLLVASPTATTSYVLAAHLGGDKALTRNTILVSTLAAAPTYALVLLGLRLLGQ